MSVIGGIHSGNLTNYLTLSTIGSVSTKRRSTSHGYLGDVAINDLTAIQSTSGTFAYAGTIPDHHIVSTGMWG